MEKKLSDLHVKDISPKMKLRQEYRQIVKTIRTFPQNKELRPIVIDENNNVLGEFENFRVVVLKSAGRTSVPIIVWNKSPGEYPDYFKQVPPFSAWDWTIEEPYWVL